VGGVATVIVLIGIVLDFILGSATGGLLLMAWMIMFTIRLFQLGSLKND
jgi:hypothetical protein